MDDRSSIRQLTSRTDQSARKLAYLTNQYPKVSHSFIRREILALERRGWQIFRLSIRGWDAELADREDVLELGKTTFILKAGAVRLLVAILRQAVFSPLRFVAALGSAIKMMRWSDRPFVWHLFYLAEACWIVPQLRARGTTHIHAHFGTNPAEVAMLARKLAGFSYSFTIHGPEEFDKARAIHLADKIRDASFVVAVCSYGRGQIFRLIDRKQWHKVHVVHCGIDRPFAVVGAVSPAKANRFACVGRLCEQKGQLLLVQAAAVLAHEGRDFELVFVGDGEHRAEIERFIAENGLTDYVSVTGWKSAQGVRDEILKARALVLPSFSEGLPIVLMEAMILGRPVLSTYVAGIPELVIDGKTGWLFPSGSTKHLLEAMRACLDTPEDVLRDMGVFARARAAQRHDADQQAEKLTGLFETAMQEAGNVGERCSPYRN